MKWVIRSLIAPGVLALGLCPLQAEPPINPKQHQSSTKPSPEWVKIIDQGDNEPRLKGYHTPAGLKVEIVADYPTVVNPVGMTFDGDGNLYVLEWVAPPEGAAAQPRTAETEITYKDNTRRKLTVLKKSVKDRVKLLLDSQKKGVYDQAKVILEDELPSSILVHDGWIYLTGQGSVRRYRQNQPGGSYDTKEIIAQGFGGLGHRQVSGLTLGNDGWLYVSAGAGDHYVEGSDGSRATVLRTGAVFRCRPDGSRIHLFAQGFINPYRDVAFDTQYQMFHADNDSAAGSKTGGCRLMHVAEGCDFGELPGKMAPMLRTGRGSPAGLLIYNDTCFPADYRGLLYYPDVYRRLIRAYQVEPKGATFEVTHEFEFLKSNDPLFRPCQMIVGPDGAMYVCDWRTDSGGAGRLWGDNRHGRIYRLSWAGTKEQPAIPLRGIASWTKIGKLSEEELLKALGREDFSDRQRAQEELRRRGAGNRANLIKLLDDGEQTLAARIAALGVLQSFWNDDVSAVYVKMLRDPSPELRRLAADGVALNTPAGAKGKTVHEALVTALGDEDPSARRAIVLAIGRIAVPDAEDPLLNVLRFDDGKDEYLHDGILRAIEAVGKPGIDKVLSLADSGEAREWELAVTAFKAFRSRAAYEALPRVLKNVHLTNAQRADLIRSYGNYLLDPPVSLEPVADYLAALPRPPRGVRPTEKEAAQLKAVVPIKLAGLAVLASAGPLQGAKAQRLLIDMLDETNPVIRFYAIQAVEETRLARAAPKLLERLRTGSPGLLERVTILKALCTLEEQSGTAAPK